MQGTALDQDYVSRLALLIASCCRTLDKSDDADLEDQLYYNLNHEAYDKAARGYLDYDIPKDRALCYGFCGNNDIISETIYLARTHYWDELCAKLTKNLDLL